MNSAFPPAKFLAPLCHQIWPSEDLLPQIQNIPILFLSGLKDEIVPYVALVVDYLCTDQSIQTISHVQVIRHLRVQG